LLVRNKATAKIVAKTGSGKERFSFYATLKAPWWYAVQVRFFFPFTKRKEEQNKFTTMMAIEQMFVTSSSQLQSTDFSAACTEERSIEMTKQKNHRF